MILTQNLTKIYLHRRGNTVAVKNVSLSIHQGEILSLVGESGCGKSTLAHMLMGLLPPTSGTILFGGEALSQIRVLPLRMQIVFQDSLSSLNPRMRVADLIDEPPLLWKKPPRSQELLDLVGLSRSFSSRYPHELSGGERQRVSIARALSLTPSFLIFDEALSSLDLITQSQIVQLLLSLHRQLSLTYLFISHNIPLVRSISHRIAHMHRGEIANDVAG